MKSEKDEYERLLENLRYSLHELPAGVLYGANGATDKQCAELMAATFRLEELASALGLDVTNLLSVCRWHYERYPHYLGRQRHFGTYANYMERHMAPAYGPTMHQHGRARARRLFWNVRNHVLIGRRFNSTDVFIGDDHSPS